MWNWLDFTLGISIRFGDMGLVDLLPFVVAARMLSDDHGPIED